MTNMIALVAVCYWGRESTQLIAAQGAADAPLSALQQSDAPSVGAEYLLDVWSTDDGLPNNTVSSIGQTRDGYLWCATYDGVVRFDGSRFVRIGPDDPINQEANRIQCVYVDSRDRLWIGTDGGGLACYTNGGFEVYAEPPGSSLNSVRCAAEDAAGDLWIGTRGGLGRLKGGRVTWFTEATGVANGVRSIWNLAFGPGGDLWIAGWNEFKVFRRGRFESADLDAPLSVPLRAIYAEPGGSMWAGMMHQALRLDSERQWVSSSNDGVFTNLEVTAFCRTRSGEFWAGTRKGLYRLEGAKWNVFRGRENGFNAEIRALFEDREGNLWIGTGTDGLARLKRRLVTVLTAKDGLTDGAVMGLCQTPQGTLWAGLADGRAVSFERFSPPVAKASDTPERPGSLSLGAPIRSILQTDDGALWVGSFGNGLVRFYNGQRRQMIPSVGSPARTDKVLALLQDRAGSLWVGTFYSLYRFDGTNLLSPVLVDGREVRAPVAALLQDRAGGIWFASEGLGVARLPPEAAGSGPAARKAFWLTRRDGLPTHFVRALYEDTEGVLWIGTAAGLCCWHDGRVSVLNKGHGLLDDNIVQIVDDGSGNLWLGSNNGIMRVARRDLLAVTKRQKNFLEVFACGRGEGMLSEQCLGGFSPAGLRTRDGNLLFPTARGLVMVEPNSLQSTAPSDPPPVYIEEVRVNGETVSRIQPPMRRKTISSQLEVFPARARRIEFLYTGLSLAAPERVRFRYRLDGFDSDWTEAGSSRSALYPKLGPGRYRFQVTASNHNGVWNTAANVFTFRIMAPLWQRPWFVALLGIAAAGLISGGVRLISVRHLRRKLRRLEEAHALEKERMRIAQDMHDEIGGKLSRISFLSDLARREMPAESSSGQQIDEVSEAAREVIRTVDEIVWAVSPRNDTIESLVHYICRHAEEFFELTPIELELELPAEFPTQKLSADLRHNLFCAVKEALNNTLKHSDATKVQVRFETNASALRVEVVDNGCGFESNGSPEPARVPVRHGNGLVNMRERLQSIGGRCEVTSRIGHGTAAVFMVPLR